LLARTVLNEAGANNNIIISGVQPGTQLNGVTISFVDTGLGAGNETVTYNATARTLVFDISNGVTTANDLVQLVNTDPTVSVVFSAALDPSDGSPNSGAGTYGLTTTATLSGGAAETIVGRDVNPLEVDGVFNALMRLSAALKSNDELGMQRALDLLDQASLRVNFARADFGARQQGLDLLDDRLNSEDTDLRQALSKDLDADFTRVVSDLTARQASLQAALQTTAQTFRLSLLDYL
jgi:flagellin-like hook-associated protein FlgL